MENYEGGDVLCTANHQTPPTVTEEHHSLRGSRITTERMMEKGRRDRGREGKRKKKYITQVSHAFLYFLPNFIS